MKTARRQAREIALQALYAWQLSGEDPLAQARSLEGFEKTDARFVEGLLRGVIGRADELRGMIAPHLSREFARLSPIQRALLDIGRDERAASRPRVRRARADRARDRVHRRLRARGASGDAVQGGAQRSRRAGKEL